MSDAEIVEVNPSDKYRARVSIRVSPCEVFNVGGGVACPVGTGDEGQHGEKLLRSGLEIAVACAVRKRAKTKVVQCISFSQMASSG